jgi:hypothetical protein
MIYRGERMKLMLRKEFGPILGSRDAVGYLSRKIEETDSVTLDFKEVEFISRSFAHELWMYIHSHPEKRFRLINMSSSVKKMWKLIERQLTTGEHERREDPEMREESITTILNRA